MAVAQMSAVNAPSRVGAVRHSRTVQPSARMFAVVPRVRNVRRSPIHAAFGGSCGNGAWSPDAARRMFNAYGRTMAGRPGSFSGSFCFPGGGFWTSTGMTSADAEKALQEMYKQWQKYMQAEAERSGAPSGSTSSGGSSYGLPLDVTQDELKYVVYADVPGLSKSDLSIKLSKDNVLTIAGTRKAPVPAQDTSEASTTNTTSPFLLQQRTSGPFERKWTLPEDADTAAISAKVTDGVLAVTIGKKAPEPEVEDTLDIPWV